jgi:hypothetical protein
MFLALLILLQPGIILYDRIVMQAAASQGCRMLLTLPADQTSQAHDAIEAHVAAVPDTEAFHAGTWTIEMSGTGEDECVEVRISHALKPLPLVSGGFGLLGLLDGGGWYHQEVVQRMSRDEWLQDAGIDPDGWVSRWDGGL